jgi:NAD(P)-dependent dehydrogenase (short-subunit alcohol dehydrogenase family)
MRLEGKVAVVTGASSGIGKAIADLFVREGANVIYSDINVFKEVSRDGPGKAKFVRCDVSKSSQVEKLAQASIKAFGKLDIMVNNAGIGGLGGILEETEKGWEKVISVNLSGVFYGMRSAAKYMQENKIKGSIINMSSILGSVGFDGASVGLPGAIAYCASKGGIVQLTRAGSLDLAPFKIRVNAIAPGFIRTAMTEDVLKNKAFSKLIKSSTPLGYVGDPRDIANAALYLASDEASYVTGQVLYVDGGWTAR